VRRLLLRSAPFVRAARRVFKKDRCVATEAGEALELLSANAFHPHLRTHKLKGRLDGYYACSAAYDLRIIFRFVQYEGAEAILFSWRLSGLTKRFIDVRRPSAPVGTAHAAVIELFKQASSRAKKSLRSRC
jgi:mRNA-degrading endonuclease YafQ of YafQ-DinJ toxin-antitoxin module